MIRRPSPVDLAGAALLVLLGGAAFGWVFGWRSAEPLVWVAILVASLVPVAVGAGLARAGARLPVSLLVQAVAWFAAGTALVLAAGGDAGGFARGVVSAWGSLVTFTLPAGGDPELLVVPVTVCWLGAVVAVEATVRTRSPFAPALAGAGVLVAARLFGPGGSDATGAGHALLAGRVVAVAVVVAAHRCAAAAGAEGSRVPWARAALPVALVLAVVAGGVGALLPFDRSAATLRSLHDPAPADDVAVANPLDGLTGDLLDGAGQPVLDLAVTIGPVPDGRSPVGGSAPRLRLVTLDTYDGVEWSSAARYLRAGAELPAPAGVEVPTVEVRQTVAITDLAGPWLPTVGAPRTVTLEPSANGAGAPTLAFDASSGGLAVEGGGSATGLRYSVTSHVPTATAAELQGAGLPASAELAPFVALPPGLPSGLGEVANQAMGRAASPFQQLVSLEAWMRANGDLDVEAPGGTSYGALARFLAPQVPVTNAAPGTTRPPSGPVGPGAGAKYTGTPQQFATAFAVLARSRGLPSRVVIGYRTDAAVAAGGATVAVPRGEVAIWPEAYLDPIGWIPFDPFPVAATEPSTPVDTQVDQVTEARTDAVERASDPSQAIPPAGNPILAAEEASTSRPWPVVLAVVGAVAVVVLLVVLVGRPLRRRARRRRLERERRTAAADRARVLGAWHHVVDHLEARGAGPLLSATTTEVVERSRARWGDAVAGALAPLAALVNDTAFSPDGDDASPAGPAGAEAWRLADAAVAALAAARDPEPVPSS